MRYNYTSFQESGKTNIRSIVITIQVSKSLGKPTFKVLGSFEYPNWKKKTYTNILYKFPIIQCSLYTRVRITRLICAKKSYVSFYSCLFSLKFDLLIFEF